MPLEKLSRKKSIGTRWCRFPIGLTHSDRINVGYILTLLQLVVDTYTDEQRQKYQAQVYDIIAVAI